MENLRMMTLFILVGLMWLTIGTKLWFLIFILWSINAIIVYFKDIKN